MRAMAVALFFAAGCLAPVPIPDRPDQPTEGETPDSLALAAACLNRGDDATAATHLTDYVNHHPDEYMTRAMLAEILYRTNRYPEAREEFERVVTDAPPATGKLRERLIHCHTRLMQIAESSDDPFGEHLHRGIAMILLVQQWDADPVRRDEQAAEATLGKAVKALKEAQADRPTDPRVHLYLSDAYRRFGVASAERAARSSARNAAPFDLSPDERRRIVEEN
ncbi:MAG TPA: tetratricopeptide repeat protein [Fimbriiglobus sp.]|jgi:tetratricopeptide (TPR) repeat protein